MAVNLTKGGRVNLTKDNPNLNKLRIGLGWSPNTFSSGFAYDLDVTAFVLKQNDLGESKILSEEYIVFYNQKATPEKAVVHSGDNRTGDGDGDDETVMVELNKLPAAADEISFIVTIFEAATRKQNFGQVSKSYISITDDETGTVLARYDLEEDFSGETAVQFGSLYKKDGNWSFKAVGQGYNVGLAEFVKGYGGQVA